MTDLSSIPADQRAVLQLVLQQGQGYEEIAEMLGMEVDHVRSRARAAVDALGPESGRRLTAERRGELADYLLGQQDGEQREATRDHLAESAGARAWARVVAGELKPMAREPLADIPGEGAAAASARTVERPRRAEVEEAEEVEEVEAEEPAATVTRPPARPRPRREPARRPKEREPEREEEEARPSSRLGGALLLGGLAVLVAVLLIVLINGGDDESDEPTTRAPTATQPRTQAQQPRVVAQINLRGTDDAVGVAQVLIQGGQRALAIVGQELEPSTSSTAYAVWLYNTRRDARRLGFAPPVRDDGRLQGVAPLPQDAARFEDLVVTQESNQRSRLPGRIVLRGKLQLEPQGR